MKINYYKLFRKLLPEAKKVYYDKGRFQQVVKDSMATMDKKEVFSTVRREMEVVFLLCMDIIRGRYRQMKKKNIFLIIVALLYLLNPVDIVPDFLLGLGFLDDVTVLTFVLSKLKKELDAYEDWRSLPND